MKAPFIKYLWILGLLLYCASVNAQQPYALQLNNQNGLPSNTIFNLHQDKKGFMWLATGEGLFRYDGFEYQPYKSVKQTSTAGSDIKEDRYGRIWYENFDGFIYYVENDSLKHFSQNAPIGFVTYGITDKNLFVVQKKGIDIFELKNLSLVKTIPIPMEEAEYGTTNVSDFYLMADHVLYKVDASFQLLKTDFFKDKNLKVKYIYPYKDQLYVVSKFNETKQLYFFDTQLNFQKTIPIPEIEYVQGSNVIDDVIWMHSSKGVFAYTENGKSLFKNGLFTANSSSEIIKDHQNNYWFSSTNNGIYIVPKLQDKIYPIQPFHPLKIAPVGKGYLIGTKKGELIHLGNDFVTKKILHSISENLPTYYVYHDSIDQNTFFSDSGFSLVSDENYSKAKNYKIALKEIVRIDEKYYALSASGFSGLFLNPKADKTKRSVWDALFTQNQDKEIPEIARIKKGLRAKSIDYNPEKQKLILAANVGLFVISSSKEKEIKLNNQPFYADKVAFFKDDIFALNTKGTLYKITQENTFENLNQKWKIQDSDIRKIKKSGQELLITGSECIYVYNFQNGSFEKIDFDIKGNRVNDILKNGNHLILLTDDGILKLSLDAYRKKRKVLFQINSFLANNQERNWTDFVPLRYHENTIELHFSILEFIEKTTPFYYRINKGEWILVNNKTRSIQFPSLSPGAYLLEFKVGEAISSQKIHFEINNPFWTTWWFYLICFLVVSFLVYAYFRWQSKLMKNQIRLLNEKVILEKNLSKSTLASIKSQMNPHFFYNALNTIQAYIFTNDKQKANTYLAKFSKLTRIILEMSEQETISLNEEIEALSLYLELEKMRFTENFQYSISVKNIPNKESVELPPMLIQPYVENAIKHGLLHREGEKRLHINFERKDNLLLVSIDDNGIGRNRSEELNKIKNEKHHSFASQANEKRLEILNKGIANKIAITIIDKQTADGIASGTTVVLFIPIA